MLQDYLLPISILMGIFTFTLAARWYAAPWIRTVSTSQALEPLLLLHALRYIGLAFLIEGVTSAPLDPRFAEPAAWGDLIAALLALVSLGLLRGRVPGALGFVWVFNVFGFLDLINAVWQGFRLTPDGHLGATYFIPAVAVPALLVTHGLIFWILLRGDRAEAAAA